MPGALLKQMAQPEVSLSGLPLAPPPEAGCKGSGAAGTPPGVRGRGCVCDASGGCAEDSVWGSFCLFYFYWNIVDAPDKAMIKRLTGADPVAYRC